MKNEKKLPAPHLLANLYLLFAPFQGQTKLKFPAALFEGMFLAVLKSTTNYALDPPAEIPVHAPG